MAFTGDEGTFIDPATANKWIDNYEQEKGLGAIKAEFFGFRLIEQLIAQKGAIGIRVYFAKNDAGEARAVLVAAGTDEINIGPIDGAKTTGLLLENGMMCPPYCGGGG